MSLSLSLASVWPKLQRSQSHIVTTRYVHMTESIAVDLKLIHCRVPVWEVGAYLPVVVEATTHYDKIYIISFIYRCKIKQKHPM